MDASFSSIGANDKQYFIQAGEGAISTPTDFMAAPLSGVPVSSGFYGTQGATPYTPAPTTSYSPPMSSVGTSSLACSTPSLTNSDNFGGMEQPVALYGGSTTSPTSMYQTMSLEEAVLSKTFQAANASIIPSLLISEPAYYTPSPAPRPSRKHPRSSHRKSVSSTSQRVRVPSAKRNASPRNIQAGTSDISDRVVYYARVGNRLLCPLPDCTRTAARTTDMDRHVETHYAEGNQKKYICCGVRMEDAAEYGIEDVSGAYLWEGLWMVGGCQGGFTRKDSLRRHIANPTQPCRGDAGMSCRLLEMMRVAASAGQAMEDSEDDLLCVR